MNPILHDLQNKQWIWSAANAKQSASNTKLSTGFNNLDKVLSGGFPRAGMVHVESVLGCGELRLMLSIIKQAAQQGMPSQNDDQKLYVFVNPPFHLNAEFLLAHNITLAQLLVINAQQNNTDALWSAEQCLKSGACHAVFVWQKNIKHTQIRKLEVAAQQGESHCVWLDANTGENNEQSLDTKNNLPLSLSMSVTRHHDELIIKINKQKIGWAQKSVKVPLAFTTQTNRGLKQRLWPALANNNELNNVVAMHANSRDSHR